MDILANNDKNHLQTSDAKRAITSLFFFAVSFNKLDGDARSLISSNKRQFP